MKCFKSPRKVQRFLSVLDQIANVLTRHPNQDTATKFHSARSQALSAWAEITGVARAAKSFPIAGRHSTDRVSRNSIDEKLTVPPQALATINARDILVRRNKLCLGG